MVDLSGLTQKRGSRQRVDPPADGPELVIALVRPVGTPDQDFHEKLTGHLHSYGYETKPIKLSAILADSAEVNGHPAPVTPEDERINALMSEGDRLCRGTGEPAAIALLGVNEIRDIRLFMWHEEGVEGDESDLAGTAIPRTAYVLDSIKRPAELTQLRQIYGDHLLVVALQATVESRQQALSNKIRPQRVSAKSDEVDEIVRNLIRRDLQESGDPFDQNTLQTFPLADVFIDVDGDVGDEVERVIDLLFGCPTYQPPTDLEFAMQVAQAASTRTAELGLKVGAVLMDESRVVGIGANEHPTSKGAPEFDASAVDIRALVVDTVEALADLLSESEKERFQDDPDGYAKNLLEGPLRSRAVRSLTEFQPTVHAEMSALLDALRRGAPVSGTTLYVTAYPCHNCAKHLLALGLKVVYLEPYPKSRAASMYGAGVTASFSPFTGVAPRRYQAMFEAGQDRKEADGTRRQWGPSEKRLAQPRVDLLLDQRGIADREIAAISTLSLEGGAEPSAEELS